MEMSGWSMSPWLRPGDLLMVDPNIPFAKLHLGDLVVLRHRDADVALIHRIVAPSDGPFPFRTKGDRNREEDDSKTSWEFQGKVVRRYRNGGWSTPRWGNVFRWWSRLGLYPGQRLPKMTGLFERFGALRHWISTR